MSFCHFDNVRFTNMVKRYTNYFLIVVTFLLKLLAKSQIMFTFATTC